MHWAQFGIKPRVRIIIEFPEFASSRFLLRLDGTFLRVCHSLGSLSILYCDKRNRFSTRDCIARGFGVSQ